MTEEYRPLIAGFLRAAPEVIKYATAGNNCPALKFSSLHDGDYKVYFGRLTESGEFEVKIDPQSQPLPEGMSPEEILRAEANAFGSGARHISLLLEGKFIQRGEEIK